MTPSAAHLRESLHRLNGSALVQKIHRPSSRPFCPNSRCVFTGKAIKKGHFSLKSGARRQRFSCPGCGKNFSQTTGSPFHRLRKLHLTMPLVRARCRNMSIRDAARHLRVSKGFVERRVWRLGELARQQNEKLRRCYLRQHGALAEVQMDEMESFEHTRLKPLSISISVTPRRFILRTAVAQIPAKGPRAAVSRFKYGPRPDHSRVAFERVARTAARMTIPGVKVITDRKSAYGPIVRKTIPGARHVAVKSRGGVVAGVGEMKERGFDPMFALNQTCAKVRSQLSRMNRRTWKGTKKWQRLQDDLDLYVWWHNLEIMGLR